MNVYQRVFEIYNSSDYYDSYLTGDDQIDEKIQEGISRDVTNVKGIITCDGKLKITNYQFQDGLIYLTVQKLNNNDFNQNDYDEIWDCVEDNSEDGWMECDITIYQYADSERSLLTCFDKYQSKNKK